VPNSVKSTNAPVDFFDYLKSRNALLYARVCDLVIFEEIRISTFRLQKIYLEGVWDRATEKNLDLLWWEFCRMKKRREVSGTLLPRIR